MKRFTLLSLTLIFTSCASLFNNPYQEIQLKTNVPTRVVVLEDSLSTSTKVHSFTVKRSEEPLAVSIASDSLSRKIDIRPFNSFAYASNFFNPSLWTLGFWLIDRNSPKRYGYPTLVSVDLNNPLQEYMDYDAFKPTKQLLKVTPLKLLALHNASLELAYERTTGDDFSTQLMISWLLPSSLSNYDIDPSPQTKGFRLALEERFYFKKKAPFGPYFALELDYLDRQSYTKREFAPNQEGIDPFDYYEGSYEDTFIVNAIYLSRNFKFGYQKEFSSVFLDVYIGLGVRTRNISHSERINPEDVLLSYQDFDLEYNRIKEGKSIDMSIPLNARIGWRF